MQGRKQQLLRRYRRNKRIGIVLCLLVASVAAILLAWWLLPLALLLLWIAHEAWFADHLFYAPSDDYQYRFSPDTPRFKVQLRDGCLQLEGDLAQAEHLFLEWRVHSTWAGRWRDPKVWIGGDQQTFERGVKGLRWLNLSGQQQALQDGTLSIRTRRCRLIGDGQLVAFHHPDYAQQRMMILAPHADDAELAAFGLYSRAQDVTIVTLTQGEIEAEHYQKLGLDKAAAARLKGRLRTWDSLSIPLWGGVPQQRCVQLGYYCLQLPAMRQEPEQSFASRESGESDIRSARQFNPWQLPGDLDGAPTWNNLVADLAALLDQAQPAVIVTPHPELDPHADHVASTQALLQALEVSQHKPQTLLLYANHLHDNDRWPMGPAGCGIALPPAIEPLPADGLWSPVLSAEQQLDKAMALAMQHDLQMPLSAKKRVRRGLQRVLLGRYWPQTGEDEFFRKAVRRHELFWVRTL